MARSPAREYLDRATELAERGRYRVEPNPPVGCVLVAKGGVVGEGWHAHWGGPHAEVAALRQAGPKAKGAVAYVTLEPCAHHGKTPPCADALLRAGVREVVYAHGDPNPRTAGKGPRRLVEGGVRVRRVTLPPAPLARYLRHLPRKRPWVIAKWAMTLDGRIAARGGDARWVTSESARHWAHENLRAHADAILVGAATVRADDPALTNRAKGRQPLRVVVCGRRPLPRRARVLGKGALLLVPEGFRAPRGTEAVVCGARGRVDLGRALRELSRRGVGRLLVEGGAAILGGLFDRGLVDQVAVFLAPRIVGGSGAVEAVGGKGRPRMATAPQILDPRYHRFGGDLLVEGYLDEEG
ncbi:MAG TPA: bifunctional diaminohydroxyphosphoribosylaminopyrimidine deaminase/5-amino-6-(5-phosphoribosylamino)uracil reductase RibD [Planctomycetota bacterium]|nr:bifunctional diaminohydroxyphosphoribosylaminopyrimidine deaminase/5-amino-6-(5-phosphoribosylamino)uracil reductase RibD [Planctomycetota bacterium]